MKEAKKTYQKGFYFLVDRKEVREEKEIYTLYTNKTNTHLLMHTYFSRKKISGLEETIMAYGLWKQKIREET